MAATVWSRSPPPPSPSTPWQSQVSSSSLDLQAPPKRQKKPFWKMAESHARGIA